MAYPEGFAETLSSLNISMLAVAGASLPPGAVHRVEAYPPNASSTVENCFSSESLLLAAVIQVSLLVVMEGGEVRGEVEGADATEARFRMWDEVGPEPGAISKKCVCHNGQNTTFSKRRRRT